MEKIKKVLNHVGDKTIETMDWVFEKPHRIASCVTVSAGLLCSAIYMISKKKK